MKNIYCSIFGHQLVISKRVTNHVNEYKCKNCNFQMTTDGRGKLTPLTSKYKEINSVLERVYKKRNLRKEHNLMADR